ncbi:MAG: hypothetical protein JNK87_13540 [Bryobacterales bacterium]|nr:hypothetical protein [Bryobacterales bacterium]
MKRILFLATFLAGLALGQQVQMPPRDTWGVDRANAIFRLVNGEWRQIPGALKTITIAADESVWGIAPDNTIWKRQGEGWVQQAGQLAVVAPGNGQIIWGLGPGGQVWRRQNDNWAMVEAPKLMRYISAGTDNTVIALDNDQFIWRYTGSIWQQLPGLLTQVSVSNAQTIYGVSAGNEIWRWHGTDWTKVPGRAAFVNTTPDGEIWIVTPEGELQCWNGTAWQTLRGNFTQIAIGRPVSGKLEEDSTSVLFTGSWARQTDTAASGGAYHLSSTPGAAVTYKFTGNTIVVWRGLSPDGGALDVTVDGRPVATFDCYFRERRWQVPSVLDNLGQGEHTIVMTVASDRNPASSGNNVIVDALQAPAPYAPTTAQTEALTRLNEIRTQVGLPPARITLGATLAAQGHADYLRQNPTDGHNQVAGKAGFIGVGPNNRGRYFGYSNLVSENIWPSDKPAGSIDAVMNSIYHRVPVMRYYFNEFGIGSTPDGSNVQNFGTTPGTPGPATRHIATYPVNNQTDVPLDWDVNESPMPLPEAPRPLGFPFSLHITQPQGAPQGTDNTPTQASLVSDGGQAVQVAILDNASDRNINKGDVFVFPRTPLATGTAYTARISGSDQNGNTYTHTWRFTTAPAAKLAGSPSATLNGAVMRVLWFTTGAIANTYIEYGPTTAYGTRTQGATVNLGENIFAFDAKLSLEPGTYHYRVVATDAQGNTRMSENQTFVMPSIPTSISGISTSPGRISILIFYETNRPVASTEIQWGITTSYGNTEAGQIRDEGTNRWVSVFGNLTAATTYNFRIVAKDAQGNIIATSPNGTFTTNP